MLPVYITLLLLVAIVNNRPAATGRACCIARCYCIRPVINTWRVVVISDNAAVWPAVLSCFGQFSGIGRVINGTPATVAASNTLAGVLLPVCSTIYYTGRAGIGVLPYRRPVYIDVVIINGNTRWPVNIINVINPNRPAAVALYLFAAWATVINLVIVVIPVS